MANNKNKKSSKLHNTGLLCEKIASGGFSTWRDSNADHIQGLLQSCSDFIENEFESYHSLALNHSLVQNCSNSIVYALELPQTYAKPSPWYFLHAGDDPNLRTAYSSSSSSSELMAESAES